MLINGEQTINFADMNENKTLYANPYMVINNKEYTKHYYTEGQRIASKIGAGLLPSLVSFDLQIRPITDDSYGEISDHLHKLCQLSDDCVGFYSEYANYGGKISCIKGLADIDNNERELFFFHSDHIGSSSFITDADGYASQHLQYLPFGELFVEQRSTANYYTPYKFSGKEKDEETSYSYFGARYYMSDVSIWLSVDPMRDKYPNISPYAYCNWNPVKLVDPNGMEWGEPGDEKKQTKDAATAKVFYNAAEKYKNEFLSKSNEIQGKIDNLDKNAKNYNQTLSDLQGEQSEAMAGVSAMQGVMNDIEAAGNDKKNWFTFSSKNGESTSLGLSAKKDENGNVIYSINYAKGNGFGQPFHELSHAGEVANGMAGASFNGDKFDVFNFYDKNSQFFSEKSAYTKQFFAGGSMPNGPVNSSAGINKQYLMGIKDSRGNQKYTNIK